MSRIQLWAVMFTLIALVFTIGVSPATAQLTRGFISGTITDSSGAVLPGAQITITNRGTNIARDAVSNDAGVYRFVAVESGVYAVEFKLPGFANRRVDDVTISAAQERVLNMTMAIGGVTAEVSVVDTPGSDIAKTSASISRTLSQRAVQELPLTAATRDVNTLALLAPTAQRAPGSNEVSVNGQRARNNNYMLDGTDNNDLSVTLANARIIPEAVEEFHVQAATYSAEFGRSSGAQVSVITRSGTNQFHGEAWDFYRGNWLEPVSLTNKRAGVKETPRYVANQFGGDFAGPVFKERTFFFGLLQGNRRREAADARNATSATIPTPAGYAALGSVPLRAGQSQASRTAVLSALSFLPDVHTQWGSRPYGNVRTIAVNNTPIEVGTILFPLANPFNFWNSVARVDHRLTKSDNISYRFLLDKRTEPDVTSNLGFGSRWSGAQTVFGQNHMISHTRNFGSRFISESRLAYVRRNLDFPENDPVSPTITLSGLFTIGGLANFPQGRIQETYQLQNVSTYLVQRHSLKMGADIRWIKLLNRAAFDSKGTWSFSTLPDFLNNTALILTQAVNEATVNARQWSDFFFFQDDFKVTRDFALNMGLRYEYNTVPFGLFGTTDPIRLAAGIPGPVQPDKNNWAPRFGFAYSPSAPSGVVGKIFGEGQSSIRGGFGVGYDVLFYNILTVNTNPNVVTQRTDNAMDLFPALAPKTATATFNPMNQFVNTPSDAQNPTTHYWSLSFQRQFKRDYALEVAYVGNRSYHQVRQGNTNPPILTPQQAAAAIAGNTIPNVQQRRLNPAIGDRVSIETTAKAEYHAGYVRFDKRLSHGLVLGTNYTFSGNWSDNDESLGVADITLSSPQVPQNYLNYRSEWGRSVFDRPHRFSVYYVYEIPWFESGGPAGQAMKQVFGGWQITGTTEWQVGQPFTIRTGVDTPGIGNVGPGRPNYNPNGIFKKDPVTGDLRTFTIPIDGTGIVTAPIGQNGILANSMPGGGNLGKNTFRGPDYQLWNFSLLKSIGFTESLKLQLRGDFINVLNHDNFKNPEGRMNLPTFGQNTAVPINDTRQILLSAKLKF